MVEDVDDGTTVLYDSGTRRGTDVEIGLALGAEAVVHGRSSVYGLAMDGADGVGTVCANLLADPERSLLERVA